MADKDIAAVTTEVFALLEPRSSEERQRILAAVSALLGEPFRGATPSAERNEVQNTVVTPSLGPRASSWARHNGLALADLERAFYFHDGMVDVHVNAVPGTSKREQTANCYLLTGLRAFLATDNGAFNDADAMALCKHTRAYDKNNHPKFRAALGNLVNGTKDSGFVLAGPGLRVAAELLRELGKEST